MAQQRNACMMYAELVGGERLAALLSETEAGHAIERSMNRIERVVEGQGGEILRRATDEICAAFERCDGAVLAASEMIDRVASLPPVRGVRLGIRIGLHHGDALIEDGDVFGDSVNTAARMASLAKREQIVTTASTLKGLTNAGNIRSRSLGRARVSGKLLPIEIVDIIWQEDTSNVTTVQRAIRIDDGGTTNVKLTLRFRGQVVELNENSQPYSMGRDATNTLVVETEWVSRNHAMIEFKKGYFIVSDRSTNGTYVKLGDDDELRLHRDEIHLRKSGTISLGQAVAQNQADVLYFQCSY